MAHRDVTSQASIGLNRQMGTRVFVWKTTEQQEPNNRNFSSLEHEPGVMPSTARSSLTPDKRGTEAFILRTTIDGENDARSLPSVPSPPSSSSLLPSPDQSTRVAIQLDFLTG